MNGAGAAWVCRALMGISSLALVSCSSGFDAKWRAPARQPVRDAITGRYAGEWRSTRGSHRGALECIFTKESPRVYRADFHAHWHGFASSYSVPFHTEKVGSRVRFRGEEDLGMIFGGVYGYQGEVSSTSLSASYDSRYDTGVFELHRVPAPWTATSCFPTGKREQNGDGAVDSRNKYD
jgi:hypothetical protein